MTHNQTEALTMATRIVILNNGEVIQVGAPQEVNNTPNNLFVAQFIGSPSMNISHGIFDGGSLKIGNTNIKISKADKHILKEHGYTDKKIKFGIRPENIQEYQQLSKPEEASPFDIKVRVIELLGSKFMIYSELEEEEIVGRCA